MTRLGPVPPILLIALAAAWCQPSVTASAQTALPGTMDALPLRASPEPSARPPEAAPPVPQPRPEPDAAAGEPDARSGADEGRAVPPAAAPAEPSTQAPAPEPPPASLPGDPAASSAGVMPPEEVACRARLKDLGAAWAELPRIEEPAGCVVGHPIALSRLSDAVALEPAAVLNCEMAEAAARYTRDVMAPQAEAAFGSGLAAIANASAYVCRPRNGTATLSEHAFGNALDIGRFRLKDGRAIDVGAPADAPQSGFVAAVRGSACGPFRTVLGPGSDADHADHLHLDLAPRRNDATYCR